MRSHRHPALVLALILALAGLQTLGAVRGYLCDCGGPARWVSSARCESSCHPGRAHHDCRDRGPDHVRGEGDSHPHHEWRTPGEAAGVVKAAAELVLPPATPPPTPGTSRAPASAPRLLRVLPGAGPPAALLVAQTVVRQV